MRVWWLLWSRSAIVDCEWAAGWNLASYRSATKMSLILKEKQTEKRTFNEDRNESIRSVAVRAHTWCYPFYYVRFNAYTQTFGPTGNAILIQLWGKQTHVKLESVFLLRVCELVTEQQCSDGKLIFFSWFSIPF